MILYDPDCMRFLSNPRAGVVQTKDLRLTPYLTQQLAELEEAVAISQDRIVEDDVLAVIDLSDHGSQLFAVGGLLKLSGKMAQNNFISCVIYQMEDEYIDLPARLQLGLEGWQTVETLSSQDVWAYIRYHPKRTTWDAAEILRQSRRTVETAQKALSAFEKRSVWPPYCWGEALDALARDFPEAWDEDLARAMLE